MPTALKPLPDLLPAIRLMAFLALAFLAGCTTLAVPPEASLTPAAQWENDGKSPAELALGNFGPWAFSSKQINAAMGPNAPRTLRKWQGPLEIVITGAKSPKEEAEIHKWVERLKPNYPDRITFTTGISTETDIVFMLKRERNGADLRGTVQTALSAKYAADIPLYPNWTSSICQTLWFSRDIVKVKPSEANPKLWTKIKRNEHPVDFVIVAIQADFDKFESARFTQHTRDLMRTSCIAEETLHALTFWQDIADKGRGSTILENDPEKHPKARGLEAQAVMKRMQIAPTEADLIGMQTLYDSRLRNGMSEAEARPIVKAILTERNSGS